MSQIDIVIPVYNQANKLKKCLKSILAQTFQDFRIIIVNDGSTDNIRDVLNEYEGMTFVTLVHQNNKGASDARNVGFSHVSSEYVFFCDADAILQTHALDEMLSTLEKNKTHSYAYCSFRYGWKKFTLWPFDAKRLRQMPYIHTMSLLRANHFSGFDENLKRFQDWDLFLTMLDNGHTGVWIPKVLFKIHAGGKISAWLPSFIMNNFKSLKKVQAYNNAKKMIIKKHNLTKVLPL